jgi:hypothetical protein
MQHYKYYVTIADWLWQDSVCLIAPYPNNPKPADQFDFATDMDLSGKGLLWCARPQLFFHCTVAPPGSLCDTVSHRQLALVFFSTLKHINLSIDSVMKRERHVLRQCQQH